MRCPLPPSSPVTSVKQQRILIKIEQAKAGANDDQKDLLTRKMELKTLNEEVDKKLEEINRKLEELKAIQKNYKDLLAQKNEDELKRVKELGKFTKRWHLTRLRLPWPIWMRSSQPTF